MVVLKKGEKVVAVRPECDSSNLSCAVLWVYIIDKNGSVREECMRYEQFSQNQKIKTLFNIGKVICDELVDAVGVLLKGGDNINK